VGRGDSTSLVAIRPLCVKCNSSAQYHTLLKPSFSLFSVNRSTTYPLNHLPAQQFNSSTAQQRNHTTTLPHYHTTQPLKRSYLNHLTARSHNRSTSQLSHRSTTQPLSRSTSGDHAFSGSMVTFAAANSVLHTHKREMCLLRAAGVRKLYLELVSTAEETS
jgi:hypothetical protein